MGALYLASSPDPSVTTITSSVTNLLPDLLAVGGAAIVVGAGVLVLTRGWHFFKSLSK
jgi:hypothetical protein